MKQITVLKLGWEFPPNNLGGLSVACQNIVKALIQNNINVQLILPHYLNLKLKNCQVFSTPPIVKINGKNTLAKQYELFFKKNNAKIIYGKNFDQIIERYTKKSIIIAKNLEFDVIHAHDNMTFKAAVLAKEIFKKPLIAHVHGTLFDFEPKVTKKELLYKRELFGMTHADKIITPSYYTKENLIKNYNVAPDKIEVIYNAINHDYPWQLNYPKSEQPIVLFLGRICHQKGPEYFLKAAKKILKHRNDVTFLMAGTGPYKKPMMKLAKDLCIHDKVIFTGYLNREQTKQAYNKAHVFIMPSVSEPFGLTAVEAVKCGLPLIISKQSGASEILNHCFKVDYWDVDKIAHIALKILENKELAQELSFKANKEIENLTWDNTAKQMINLYRSLI